MTVLGDVWVEGYLDLIGEIVSGEWEKIVQHMKDDLPNECVGLIWMDGQVQRLTNQARSPHRFSISKTQLHERLQEMDASNVLVCIYHSHPGGSTRLSNPDKDALKSQWRNDLIIPWLVVTEEQGTLWYLRDEDKEVFVMRDVGLMTAEVEV